MIPTEIFKILLTQVPCLYVCKFGRLINFRNQIFNKSKIEVKHTLQTINLEGTISFVFKFICSPRTTFLILFFYLFGVKI